MKIQRRALMKEWEKPYLVQRLKKPFDPKRSKFKDNPFAFGGGLKDGGLSEGAMDILRPIFSFDYMGSAEFEFGAVPKAFQMVVDSAKSESLVTGTIEIKPKDIRAAYNEDRYTKPEAPVEVHFICHKDHKYQVEAFIRECAKGKERLKESTFLPESLHVDNVPEEHLTALRPLSCHGWLELDNGFFFFTNAMMFKGVRDLFIPPKEGGE